VADLYKGEYDGFPDRDVRTIRDLIHYQYAKIIARSAFSVPDGTAAKGSYYGFIKQTFRELQTGKKSWSEITREDWQFVQSEQRCIYCGSERDLQKEHIVPRSIRINDRCPACEKIQGIYNQIWACKMCNSAKGDRGLYSFYKTKRSGQKKYYDLIPPPPAPAHYTKLHSKIEQGDQEDSDGGVLLRADAGNEAI
jgi:ribosomal protein S14